LKQPSSMATSSSIANKTSLVALSWQKNEQHSNRPILINHQHKVAKLRVQVDVVHAHMVTTKMCGKEKGREERRGEWKTGRQGDEDNND
jgi:hypothetical protein